MVQGFSVTDRRNREADKYRNFFAEATAEDYIRFGLIPELVGRSPIRTFVSLLSKNDLVRIMTETEDSILDQYRLEFGLFGLEAEFRPEAIEYVAQVAENQRTGARALVSVWENMLTDFQFELPGSNFTRLTVDRELCERPKDALLHMLEKSPFVDYTEWFRRQYGVELALDEASEQYVEEYARQRNIQVSEALSRLLKSASALNYMNVDSPYRVTRDMLAEEGYFDRLFTEWHQRQKKTEGPAGRPE